MILGIGSVAVLVSDREKSLAWYRDVLGFEVVNAEGHPIFLRSKYGGTMLHLCSKCEEWGTDRPGGRTGIWIQCGPLRMSRNEKTGVLVAASDPTDVENAYNELKSRSAVFSEDLKTEWWGKYAILQDPDGNEFEIS